jgi:peptidoglycan hydrolase-like protein with peptidoglycan-binding domain
MELLKQSSMLVLRTILEKPASTAALAVFGLGFALVAGNALYSQQGSHPDPIWSTAKDDDSLSQTYNEDIALVNQRGKITRSVLTQRVSLKNVPVPKSNPVRSNSVASQSSLIRDTQSVLADIGFYTGKIDGIYGNDTRNAIVRFQERAELLPDGEASYELLRNLKSVKAVTGMKFNAARVAKAAPEKKPQSEIAVFDSETVTRIQMGLRENFGDETIAVDGVMGSQTRNAIKRFQKRFKIDATGELNRKTLSKMVSVGVLSTI